MNKIGVSISYALYEIIGKRLPKSNAKFSMFSRQIRSFLAKGFIRSAGKNINIERGAMFGRNIVIGDNSGIGINCVLQGTVIIGNNVMMGPEVWIYTRNHRHDSSEVPMIKQGFEDEKKVVIKDDVWIGSRVTILPGVTVGEGTIIGTASVVTKDVPPYVIIAGNPAKVVKARRQ